MKTRPIVGLTEKIVVFSKDSDEERELVARIDSGATQSSIDERIARELHLGPTVRTAMVKSAHGANVRSIIKAKVRIQGIVFEGEFSLANRRHMKYNVLIGQSLLRQGNFLIDPLRK